jgi:hypothetical protein
MQYRIITTAPGTTIETIHGDHWTHETAIDWARREGRKLPEGTRIAIDRRRGRAMYQPHRRYTVQNGITKRIGN